MEARVRKQASLRLCHPHVALERHNETANWTSTTGLCGAVVEPRPYVRCRKQENTALLEQKPEIGISDNERRVAPAPRFQILPCNERFPSENTKDNHETVWGGLREESANRRRCWKCGKEISKTNLAIYVRAWTVNEAEGGGRGNVRLEEDLTI